MAYPRPRPDARTRKRLRILQYVTLAVLVLAAFLPGENIRKALAVYGFLAAGVLVVMVGQIVVRHLRDRGASGDTSPPPAAPKHRR
jgi:hypothetical protein